MVSYAVKIDGKYFDGYIYADKSNSNVYLGHLQFGSQIRQGDIIDLKFSDKPSRSEYKRSLGNTITTILSSIEKYQKSVIEIEPIIDKG